MTVHALQIVAMAMLMTTLTTVINDCGQAYYNTSTADDCKNNISINECAHAWDNNNDNDVDDNTNTTTIDCGQACRAAVLHQRSVSGCGGAVSVPHDGHGPGEVHTGPDHGCHAAGQRHLLPFPDHQCLRPHGLHLPCDSQVRREGGERRGGRVQDGGDGGGGGRCGGVVE